MANLDESLQLFLDALEKDRRDSSHYQSELSDSQLTFLDVLSAKHAEDGVQLERLRERMHAQMKAAK